MRARPLHVLAHALAGVGLYLAMTPRHAWQAAPWTLALAALAALAPDLDTWTWLRLPHRTATHSLAAAAAVWWVVSLRGR